MYGRTDVSTRAGRSPQGSAAASRPTRVAERVRVLVVAQASDRLEYLVTGRDEQ